MLKQETFFRLIIIVLAIIFLFQYRNNNKFLYSDYTIFNTQTHEVISISESDEVIFNLDSQTYKIIKYRKKTN